MQQHLYLRGIVVILCSLCVACGGNKIAKQQAIDEAQQNAVQMQTMENRLIALEQYTQNVQGRIHALEAKKSDVRSHTSQKTNVPQTPPALTLPSETVTPKPQPQPQPQPQSQAHTAIPVSNTTASLSLPPENVPHTVSNKEHAAVTPQAVSQALPPVIKGEEAAYKSALALINAGKPEEARQKFVEFLGQYGAGRYAANAHYWIGESYFVQKNYPEALSSFTQVNTQFPRHHKNADALLRAGMTYQKLGDTENAQRQFKTLQADFPQSEAAQRLRSQKAGQ